MLAHVAKAGALVNQYGSLTVIVKAEPVYVSLENGRQYHSCECLCVELDLFGPRLLMMTIYNDRCELVL